MSNQKRTTFSAEFKAKVALAALRGDKSVPRRHAQRVKIPQCSYAAQEMRVGPSKSSYRRGLQTTYCCCA